MHDNNYGPQLDNEGEGRERSNPQRPQAEVEIIGTSDLDS